jgi:hypothetical protein
MSHKTLAELQLALQDFLLDKTVDASALTLETPNFSKQERLQIYHEAYRLRLIDALRNDYPALEAYVGHDEFIALTTEFIAEHPSHHSSLRWLGEKLPDFLRKHAHWQEHIEVVELAEFEWRQVMAFDAADTSLATLDELRTLPPEQWMTLKLELHPSLQLMHCYSNAPTLWNSLTKDKSAVAIELTQEKQAWLMWRENLQVVYRPIDTAEAWALNAFLTQNNFADVCEGLCEWFAADQVPMQAAQYLQHWIRGGLVMAIITEHTN